MTNEKQEAALRQALEAMNLARAAHGQVLLSDPPQEAWKAWGVSAALTKAMTAASEALAEQPAQPCGYPYCGCNSKAWCKLERMAENARELGLDYEPPCKTGSQCTSKCQQCEQPAKEQKLEFVSPGGGYVPAIPRPIPLDWKLVPRKATPEMLKAMDECAQEGYDERLYEGMASSVYMAAWDASPVMGSLPTSNTFKEWFYSKPHRAKYSGDHSAYLAAQEAWEAAHEACAKVCDEKVDAEYATGKVDHNEMGWTQACAIAIRARGQA